MRKISLKNYEEFFIDYAEGNLAEHEVEELNSFLIIYPDLKKELEEFDSIKLEKEEVLFQEKNFLKKKNGVSYIDALLIGKIEKSLEKGEERLLDQLLKRQPELIKELGLLEKTILIPDHSISFPEKRSLKKTPVLRRLYIPVSIAASLLIMIGVYLKKPEKENLREYSKTDIAPRAAKVNLSVAEIKQEQVANQDIEIKAESIKLIAFKSLVKLEPVNLIEDFTVVNEPEIIMSIPEEHPIAENSPIEEFKTLPELAKEISKNKIEQLIPGGKGDKSLWDYASAGINGVGKLTGLNLRMNSQKDSLGNTISTTFIAGSFEFARSKGK